MPLPNLPCPAPSRRGPRFRAWYLALALMPALGSATTVLASDKIQVVTSFSVLADIVENVGGDRIEVTSLVGPDSDPHVYSPRPGDVRALAEADLVVFNGLQFEGWMTRLLDASGYQGATLEASLGTEPLPYRGRSLDHAHADHDDGEAQAAHDDHDHDHDHEPSPEVADGHEGHDHGALDPHAWLDLAAGQQYAANVRDALIEADPDHAAEYRAQADGYIAELAATDAEIHALFEDLPRGAQVIVGHDAFGHFARAYGVHFLSPVGVSTEAEPSAADLATLIDTIKTRQIPALYLENMSSPALMEQLAEETGVPIAGTLYTGALAESGTASHYLGMVLHNAEVLHAGLSRGAVEHATPNSDAPAPADSDPAHDHDHDHDHDHEHEHGHDHS